MDLPTSVSIVLNEMDEIDPFLSSLMEDLKTDTASEEHFQPNFPDEMRKLK